MVIKFSEDYSKILSVFKIGLIKDVEYCFKTQNKLLTIKTKSSYHIFDIENFKL
jgi:hypothetical protein